MASKCISTLARSRPTSTSLSPLDHWSPSASPILLNPCLQVPIWTCSITPSKWISEFTGSQSPSPSPHSLDPGLQVHLQICSIMASKYMIKQRRQVYRDTVVTEVDIVTGSVYSADPGVDRHHLISISSHHTMKIHTLSFTTFGFTWCVRDFVDPSNRRDPQRRVVSNLLTRFLRFSREHRSSSWILFGCPERFGDVSMVGSQPSSSKCYISKFCLWACPGAPPIILDYNLWPDWPYVHIYRET